MTAGASPHGPPAGPGDPHVIGLAEGVAVDRGTQSVASLVLGVAAIAIWWPFLGPGVLWAVPMLAITVAVVSGFVPSRERDLPRLLLIALLMWPPLALLLGGLAPSVLVPTEWPGTAKALLQSLPLGLRDPGAASTPWMLASWLTGSGVTWLLGATQSRQPGRGSAAVSFVFLSIPFAAALVLRRADDAGWYGAAVLAAALLWATRGRLRATLPAVGAVALVAVVSATAVGPAQPWPALAGAGAARTAPGIMDTSQTYGPLRSSRTGQTLLEVRSERPALWRMGVLEAFDGRRWVGRSGAGDTLPQPGAIMTRTTVRVRGLRDNRAVAPGRVVAVEARSGHAPGLEDSVVFDRVPASGDTYSVTSGQVAPTLAELQPVPIPVGSDYLPYTQIWPAGPGSQVPSPAASWADRLPEELNGTAWGQVLILARRLSIGRASELDVVRQVQEYLTQGGRYRYSTNAPRAGQQPLLDFLLTSKVGYCQHFAGAASLLLRLAGVPTRVVTGFATGHRRSDGTYEVRDVDAHAWIEVYFPGYGWVPFDPTPGQAEADVAAGIDVLAPAAGESRGGAAHAGGRPSPGVLIGLVAVALAIGAGLLRQRSRRLRPAPVPLADLLVRVAPGPAVAGTTLRSLRADFAAIGPATASLADRAERERFGRASERDAGSPRRLVWAALRQDLGVLRAAALVLGGPPPRPISAPAARASIGMRDGSVAPPGGPPPAGG